MALLIRDSGVTVTVAPRHKSFTLLECYALLNCTMIQTVRMPDGRIMIVDEEGKLKREPTLNHEATRLSGLAPHDVIVGHALICDRKEFR